MKSFDSSDLLPSLCLVHLSRDKNENQYWKIWTGAEPMRFFMLVLMVILALGVNDVNERNLFLPNVTTLTLCVNTHNVWIQRIPTLDGLLTLMS